MFTFHIHYKESAKTDQILETLLLIKQKLDQMATTLDQVLESVTANATVGDSAIALLQGLKKQLDEVLSGTVVPPAVQAKIDAIFSASEVDKQKLADAIIANTPAAEGGG